MAAFLSWTPSVFPNEELFHPHISIGKPTQTDGCLNWNLKQPISSKISVVHTFIYRAKNIFSIAKILGKEIDYLYCVPFKNNYPKWMIKEL